MQEKIKYNPIFQISVKFYQQSWPLCFQCALSSFCKLSGVFQSWFEILEFSAVLLRKGNEVAEKELVSSGTIRRVLNDLFFEYPYNNSLHHHVESIIISCLESKSNTIVDHLLGEYDLIGKILQTDKNPIVSGDLDKVDGCITQPTLPATGRRAPLAGNLGHITRISNKLVQLGNSNSHIHACLQMLRKGFHWVHFWVDSIR